MSEQIGRWRVTYTPGQWVVLAGPTSLVVLQPAAPRFSAMINSFWDVVVRSDSLDTLVRQLAQHNVERMPDFAAFFWHDGEMRSLVRGALQVVNQDTGEGIATGEGVQTWTETGLGRVRRARVVMERDVEIESRLRLPLVVGAVSAAAVDLDTDAVVSSPQKLTPLGREGFEAQEDAEVEADSGVVRQSAEDRVSNLFGPVPESDFPGAESGDAEGDAQSQQAGWGPGVGAVGPGAGGPGAALGAGAAAAAGAAAGAAGAAFGGLSAAGSSRPSVTPPPLDPFGQPQGPGLFGPGPGGGYGQPGQGPGPARPGPGRPYPATEEFTPGFAQQPGPGQPSHGFQQQPPPPFGGSQPPAYGRGGPGPWQPVKAPDRGEPSGEMVLAVTCPQNHPNPPDAQRCRRCGGPLQGQPRMVPRPAMALLRPSTGAPVEVDRSVLIGRSPQANRVARDQLPRLLTVPSPSHDISRTHVHVSPDGWDLVATDLHSTNGTLLIRPGHPEPERMAPGEPMPVYPGCVLDLGDGVTILVDHPV